MTFPVAILAGGKGTRLEPLTLLTPKALLDICGKPFAVRQIELLREQGLSDIVFCVGHMGEQIKAALGDGSAWGVKLNYVFDGPVPLGTGGALRKALPFLGDSFAVLYGDSYLPCDYQVIISSFQLSGKDGLMTVFHNAGQWDRSNVTFIEGRILCYDKRLSAPTMQHIDYGLGLLRASVLRNYPAETELDLAMVYQNLLSADQLAGFEVRERFYEMGSVAGLEELREYFSCERSSTS